MQGENKMPRKEVPENYYYFADVHYKDGRVKNWRFKNKSLRKNAVAAFNKDKNVKIVKQSEGFA